MNDLQTALTLVRLALDKVHDYQISPESRGLNPNQRVRLNGAIDALAKASLQLDGVRGE